MADVVSEAEIRSAFEVLQRAVADSYDPKILVEYGPRFDQKYLFVRLDFLRTVAGAIGYDTSRMVDFGDSYSTLCRVDFCGHRVERHFNRGVPGNEFCQDCREAQQPDHIGVWI